MRHFIASVLDRLTSRPLGPQRWSVANDLMGREYDSYSDYVAHQRSKLATIKNPTRKHEILRHALRQRVDEIPEIKRGANVVCLGARYGAECEVFIERGAFAVGIDLNPGPSNRFVVTGDFHAIQYANASIDCTYTNCLDHVYDLRRVLTEVRRILKPDGVFIVDICKGSLDVDGRDAGAYESLWWPRVDSLVEQVQAMGFAPRSRKPFSEPWAGEQVVFVQKAGFEIATTRR